MVKLYASLALVAVLSSAVYGLVQYGRLLERTDNIAAVNDLQASLYDLGLVIQKQEGKAADATRKLVESEQDRINAIKTNDHQAKEVKRLERIIRQAREKFKTDNAGSANDSLHYRVVITDALERVYDEARSNSQLPETHSASILSKRLRDVTGDDIARVIKYTVGQYNACAIKYNQLWPACTRLINEGNKKPLQ